MAETDPKLLALLHKIAKEKNLVNYDIKVKPISSGGANYTSVLFVATITSKNDNDLNLFIKVACMSESFRNVTGMNMFEKEKFIYTDLKNNFRELEKTNGVAETDRLRMPEYYGASTVTSEEMIVLEDLTSRGFESQDRMKSVDWEYASAAITELAKLHALSMALRQFKPEEYRKIKEILHFEMDHNSDMDTVMNGTTKTALGVVREENREKLQSFFDVMDFKTVWGFYDTSKCEAFTHGDFRPSNLMHRRLDDGSVEVIPVDYQTIRTGSPVVDLLYFIFTGTDEQFRAQYYEKLIDHYYSELTAALTRLGVDSAEMYTREDFQSELKEKLPFGLAMAVFTLPLVTVEAENAPKVDGDLEMVDFSITKTGKLYPLRLNGVVNDFVRWGVL